MTETRYLRERRRFHGAEYETVLDTETDRTTLFSEAEDADAAADGLNDGDIDRDVFVWTANGDRVTPAPRTADEYLTDAEDHARAADELAAKGDAAGATTRALAAAAAATIAAGKLVTELRYVFHDLEQHTRRVADNTEWLAVRARR